MTPVRSLDLDALVLERGGHDENDDCQMCVMEAVAFVAGEPWSDRPECASPVIGGFLRRFNDDLDDETRQLLKPYVLRLVGSKSTSEVENARRWLCAEWMVHKHLPLWLRAAGMEEQAIAVEAIPTITSCAEWASHRKFFQDLRGTTLALRQERWQPWVTAFTAKLRWELGWRNLPAVDAVAAVDEAVDADAAAVASVDAAASRSVVYWAVRNALATKFASVIEEKNGQIVATTRASAFELIDAMLAMGAE